MQKQDVWAAKHSLIRPQVEKVVEEWDHGSCLVITRKGRASTFIFHSNNFCQSGDHWMFICSGIEKGSILRPILAKKVGIFFVLFLFDFLFVFFSLTSTFCVLLVCLGERNKKSIKL